MEMAQASHAADNMPEPGRIAGPSHALHLRRQGSATVHVPMLIVFMLFCVAFVGVSTTPQARTVDAIHAQGAIVSQQQQQQLAHAKPWMGAGLEGQAKASLLRLAHDHHGPAMQQSNIDEKDRPEEIPREGGVSTSGNDHHVELHLTAWPAAVEDGGDVVITWHGHLDVHEEDYLTLSCGPTIDDGDFLVRKNVTDVDAQANSVRFAGLYMMRCNYTALYFSYQPQQRTHSVVASIEIGMRESFNTPKHGHLALTTKSDAMAIMFNSASKRLPRARYGLSPSELTKVRTGNSTTYEARDMCHAPANQTAQRLFRDPGFMHTVIMSSLQPERRYFYQYGNDEDGWSQIQSFVSPPARTAKNAKFIAYADMGVDGSPAAQSTAMRVYHEVVANGYESFLLHFGDISYARGEGSVWDKFFHIIEPYATRIPYMVSIGNHEYDYVSGGKHDPSGAGKIGNGFHPYWGNYGEDSLGECSVPMFHRWHVPSTGNSIYWYSFDYGGVHVIQLSSEHDWTRGSVQHQWLEHDLKNVDRSITPWVVVTAHRMLYSTQEGLGVNMLVASHFREELEDLLFSNHVNLVLSDELPRGLNLERHDHGHNFTQVGHQHSYERSCPLYHEECVTGGQAPVYIVVGSAGFELATQPFSTTYGEWSVRHANEYGFLRVASSASAMDVEFVLNRNGAVYDHVTLQPWL
ncbi:TPA: LOW QUALITY PROTEIN: hypothetical protein N0F65_003440 [Lagenidium giganteum]|uniref:Purple acid phosphatase n=1 Tax=Lagenidium giganteum TaxID=4803 RepID=A0AAV2YJX2_9STRA|nr:TPA: LOW QUALITY PROTEIN: hypothetical protein N0F65_003440 [Lagenidium giganteum]